MIIDHVENMLAQRLSLDGTWTLHIADKHGPVTVPGAWEAQGYPDVAGPAIYTRAFTVPANWEGGRVLIAFGAVSYLAEILVNDQLVGTHQGLWTAFTCDVTEAVRFGAENTITVQVTKAGDDTDRFPYRETLVGFIPYISSTFGGLWQSVELIGLRGAAFADVRVQPDYEGRAIRVSGRLMGGTEPIRASVCAPGSDTPCVSVDLHAGEGFAGVLTLPMEAVRLWSPEDPACYRVVIETVGAHPARAERLVGLRRLAAIGERLEYNGAPVHLRGVLSWGWQPEARAPLFDDDAVRALFRQVREMGCNLFKLCLYLPPPRFFKIADEEGMWLWLELPMWYQRRTPGFGDQVRIEYADMLAQFGHHPSIVIVSLGCELEGDMADAALIADLDAAARDHVVGALVCDNSGSGEAYGGQFGDLADFADYHFYCELHQFVPLCDHFRRDWRPHRPWIFGEFCDCDDYRDPATLAEDGRLPAWRDLLGKDGGIHRWAYRDQEPRMAAIRAAGDFPFSDADLQAGSRATSFVFRKLILERTRARRDIGGYVITGLRDTPIATSGLFDDHGALKYDPSSFRTINAPNVLLLERARARIWRNGGDRPAPLDRFNHRAGAHVSFVVLLGNQDALDVRDLSWSLRANGQTADEGQIHIGRAFASSGPHEIATIEVTLPPGAAGMGALHCTLTHAGGEIVNVWSQFWYPDFEMAGFTFDPALNFGAAFVEAAGPVRVLSRWSDQAARWVAEGGRAIVLEPDGGSLPTVPLPFWREAVKLLHPPPALDAFPHAGYADMQFYSLATDRAIDRAQLQEQIGARVTPIISRLDARLFRLTDYAVTAKIGAGSVVFSTLRHGGGRGDQVEGAAANLAGLHLLTCFAG